MNESSSGITPNHPNWNFPGPAEALFPTARPTNFVPRLRLPPGLRDFVQSYQELLLTLPDRLVMVPPLFSPYL
jgi:hypothetical protein